MRSKPFIFFFANLFFNNQQIIFNGLSFLYFKPFFSIFIHKLTDSTGRNGSSKETYSGIAD